MIRQIILRNFYAFNGEQTVNLNPGVNILLGINGSGKTSLINSLIFLYEGVCGAGIAEYMRHNGGYNAILNARGIEKPDYFNLTYIFDAKILKRRFPQSSFNHDIHYSISVYPIGDGTNYTIRETLYEMNDDAVDTTLAYIKFTDGKGDIAIYKPDSNHETEHYKAGILSPQELVLRQITDPQRYFPLFILREAISTMAIYGKFNIDLVRRPSEISNNDSRLVMNGVNLAYLYNGLHNKSTLNYNKIRTELNSINPNYKDIGYSIFGNRIYMHLVEENLSHTIDMIHISDGTIKFMLLMGIFYNPMRGYLCGIDEPESYLHPDMIRSVAKMIKMASNQTQLIIATHSPLLLNAFKLSDILVFQKDASNNTTVLAGNKIFICQSKEDMLPGQLWLNGEIGGTRW